MASTPKIEPTTSPTPTAFGMLSRIPPEIRLKIYHELVLGGSVRFLESSKAIHGEAIEVLLRGGVCRLEFNDYKLLNTFLSAYWSRSTIMNFEIRLVLKRPYRVTCECIKRFNEWMTVFLHCVYTKDVLEPRHESTRRKSCKILLDCHKTFFPHLPEPTFNLIRFMDGFEVLALAIADDYPAESIAGMRDRLEDPEPFTFHRMQVAMHRQPSWNAKELYELAKEALQPTLGAGDFICDGKGAHLEFHPRDYDSVKSRRKMCE